MYIFVGPRVAKDTNFSKIYERINGKEGSYFCKKSCTFKKNSSILMQLINIQDKMFVFVPDSDWEHGFFSCSV